MKIRKLEDKDAVRMLEWMHDPAIVGKLRTDFGSKTIEDCRSFIKNSTDKHNVHYAITDDDDLYMGTVSLKNIFGDRAEFGIALHGDAIGKGYSLPAMEYVLDNGFKDYGLDYVFWCVAPDNLRALRFYDKNGFKRTDAHDLAITDDYTQEMKDSYIWYKVTAK